MRIGITDTFNEDKFEQYIRWIRSLDDSIEIQKLTYENNGTGDVETLDGFILAGGGDVHPRYYEKEHELAKARGINDRRDEFEFAKISQVLDAEIPILGVCRGMQVMNVYLGGSLSVDLVSDGFNNHTSPSGDHITNHPVSVVPHSLLHALTGSLEVEVNSFHHQGVDRLGKGLVCSALSPDGVIEAAEWAIKDNMPFLMLVQWHPERLAETFLSQKLARLFLREVQHYQSNKEPKKTEH